MNKEKSPYSKDLEYKNNSSACVLMLHGLASTPYELKPWAEKISELGIDVKVPLLPFHGVNSEELRKIKSADIMYDWGKQLMDRLNKQYHNTLRPFPGDRI